MDLQIREGSPEGQLNINLASMEAEGRKSVLNSLDTSTESRKTAGKTEEPEVSDTAKLSDTAKDREITPELRLQMMLNWTLEQLGKDWFLLLNFMPLPGADPALLLEELYALYHLLEAEIMKNTFGPAMQREMTRLDQAFSAALNRIWQFSMTDMVSFFENFGTDSQLQWLKSGVHYLATGERLTPKELEQFWRAGNNAQIGSEAQTGSKAQMGNKAQTGNKLLTDGQELQKGGANLWHDSHKLSNGEAKSRFTGRETSGGYQAFTEKGSLYQAKGREVTFVPHQGASSLDSSKKAVVGGARDAQSVKMMSVSTSFISPEKQGLFSARDLRAANEFIKYASKEGSLFSQPYFNNSNEELLGLLSAITAIKGREFRLASPLGVPIGNEIQSLLEGYIENSVKQRDESLRNESLKDGEKQKPLQQKEIYRTYYYTMNQYQKNGKADRAILEGIRYAVEVFQEKRLNTIFSQYKRYDSDTGFFHSGFLNHMGQAERMEMDLKKGAELLERDWKSFLKYVGKAQEKVSPFAGTLKALRLQATDREPLEPKNEIDSKHMKLLIIGALSFVILLFLLVRLFI